MSKKKRINAWFSPKKYIFASIIAYRYKKRQHVSYNWKEVLLP